MKRSPILAIAFLLATIATPIPGRAHDMPPDSVDGFWLSLGLGGGTPSSIAASAGFTVAQGGRTFSLRGIEFANFERGGIDHAWYGFDVGLLYGTILSVSYPFLSVSAGLAIAHVEDPDLSEQQRARYAPALTAELRYAILFGSHPDNGGIGAAIYFDANPVKPFGGLLLTVQLGC